METAKVLFVAGYDTPLNSFDNKCQYSPFDNKINKSQEYYNLALQFALTLAVGICYYYLFCVNKFFINLPAILKTSVFIFLMALCYLFIMGFPNRNNFNRNTSSITVLTSIIDKIKFNDKIAFCFLDQKTTNEGIKVLSDLINEKNPDCEIIILDCIGNGKEIYKISNISNDASRIKIDDESIKNYFIKDKEDYENSTLKLFKRCTYITSADINNDGNIIINKTRTSKDNVVDIERLEEIEKILMNGINKYLINKGGKQ